MFYEIKRHHYLNGVLEFRFIILFAKLYFFSYNDNRLNNLGGFMTATEQIKIMLIKKGMSVTELAAKLGSTSQNLSGKFKRDNFSEKDLRAIADALDCNLEINFIEKDK